MMEFETYERCKEPWTFINEQIARSKIKRYKWQVIFGESLTNTILTYKMKGHKADEVVKLMINHESMKNIFMEDYEMYEDMCKKIKISVYARFGENNSALRLYRRLNEN